MQNFFQSLRFLSLLVMFPLLLSACGGSSPGPITAAPTPNLPTLAAGPTWTNGVFEAENNFKNRCEAPRSGINPATGSAYPDVAGSTLFENHWLRSWSNDTYLWYDEIEDMNPASFTDRLA